MIRKCLFCGRDSASSKSVEHIIPESLGNTELILPQGVVCDKCNNYFAQHVENAVLSLPSFRDLCFYETIPNKKGKLKSTTFYLAGEECKADWAVVNGKQSLLLGASFETIINIIENPPKVIRSRTVDLDDCQHRYEISRFLYKIGIEYYAYSLIQLDEFKDADRLEFDDNANKIISFVRNGNRQRRYLSYRCEQNSNYKPFESSNNISLKFVEEVGDLILQIFLIETTFSINLSNPIYCT